MFVFCFKKNLTSKYLVFILYVFVYLLKRFYNNIIICMCIYTLIIIRVQKFNLRFIESKFVVPNIKIFINKHIYSKVICVESIEMSVTAIVNSKTI